MRLLLGQTAGWAQVGGQAHFVTHRTRTDADWIACSAMRRSRDFIHFLEEKAGLRDHSAAADVSPANDLHLSDQAEAMLHRHLARDFELYDTLTREGPEATAQILLRGWGSRGAATRCPSDQSTSHAVFKTWRADAVKPYHGEAASARFQSVRQRERAWAGTPSWGWGAILGHGILGITRHRHHRTFGRLSRAWRTQLGPSNPGMTVLITKMSTSRPGSTRSSSAASPAQSASSTV